MADRQGDIVRLLERIVNEIQELQGMVSTYAVDDTVLRDLARDVSSIRESMGIE